MADPFSLAAVGSLVLSEGVKFLYGQATDLLKRLRDRREANRSELSEEIELAPSEALDAPAGPARLDFGRAEANETAIAELRAGLLNYADGVLAVDTADQALLEKADALRGLLELVYGQRFTLRGETREPTGTRVRAELVVDEIAGKVAVVRTRMIGEAAVHATARVKTVASGGDLTVVDADTIGA